MARGKEGLPPKGGKKNRKHGRSKKWCQKYSLENRKAKNKELRRQRHLKKHPNDLQAR